jgi:hypothetical protein
MKPQPWQRDLLESINKQSKIIATGRQAGKSSWAALSKTIARMMERDLKIQWKRLSNNRIRAICRGDNTHFDLLQESDMDPIQEWCESHRCGVRTSFDTFKFKDKKQLTMFILRWGA